jgi:oligopeptide/dipeptide ABC transporter ATP-binding protein
LFGDVPSPITPPAGCHFHTRCPKVFDRCRKESPVLRELRPNHFVSCFLYEQVQQPARG